MNHIRYYKYILLTLIAALTMISCLNNDYTVSNPSSNASITYVYIQKNDSSPNASSASFTIDNVDNIIYNVDSLPYGTRIDSLYIGFYFASSLGFIMNDTVSESNYNTSAVTTDAYDLSKPVKITNVATDGESTKTYTIELRVHKADSYLHVWTLLNNNVFSNPTQNQKALLLGNKFLYYMGYSTSNALYSSADAINWHVETGLTGLPVGATMRSMIVFNGTIYLLYNGNQICKSNDGINWTTTDIVGDSNYEYTSILFGGIKDKLWAVAKNKLNNTLRIANSSDGVNWEFSGDKTFDTNFPISDFSATVFKPKLGRTKIVIIGGNNSSGEQLNTVWTAENSIIVDTLSWYNLTNPKSNLNKNALGATEYYGNKLLYFSGTSSSLNIDDIQLRQSANEGLNWATPDSTQNKVPDNFTRRYGASLVHDEANHTLYVIGGKSSTAPLSDVWKIKVNFYNFDDYLTNPNKY